jgi:AraC family transcriptional regulator
MTLVFSGANHSMTPIIPDLLTKLIAVVTGSTVRERTKARGALEEALASLGTNVGHSAFPTTRPPRGGLAGWQAKRVARYIDEHIGTPFKAGDLAAQVQLSNAHFFRAFKASFGTTPAAYIMRQRIRFAQGLMVSTGYPLSQVALECGMCDQSHLCRAFRRVVGNTPSQWRRQFAFDPEARTNRAAALPHHDIGMNLAGE